MKKWLTLFLCAVLSFGTLTVYGAEKTDTPAAVEEAISEEEISEDEDAVFIPPVLLEISNISKYENGFWAATSQYTLHYIVDEESILTVHYDAENNYLLVAVQVTALSDTLYNEMYEQILTIAFPQKDAKTLINKLKSYSWDTHERILAGHFDDEDQFVQLFYNWILL